MTTVGDAAAITRSVEFSGPEQILGAELSSSLDGTIEGVGSTFSQVFVLDPNPQPFATNLNPNPTMASTHPISTAPAQFTFDDTTGQLLDIDGLEMSILSGQAIPFAYDTVTLDVLFNGMVMSTLDVSIIGEIRSLNFT